jgi:hypothetical protein
VAPPAAAPGFTAVVLGIWLRVSTFAVSVNSPSSSVVI